MLPADVVPDRAVLAGRWVGHAVLFALLAAIVLILTVNVAVVRILLGSARTARCVRIPAPGRLWSNRPQ